MGRTPRLFVISGPSGVGKGTLVERLRKMRPDLGVTVSATTRKPRPGEVDGVSYHFLTDEEFSRRVEAGEFLEWAQVHDHRYGTLRSEVDRLLRQGHSVVLEIDVQGGSNVKRLYPDSVGIFIEPPSLQTLEERLRGRGTEDDATVRLRMADAQRELELAPTYDVRIVNDDLERATDELARTLERFETTGGTISNGNHQA